MKRKYLLLVAAIVALLVFAACGNNDNGADDDQNGADQQTQDQTTTDDNDAQPGDDNDDPAPLAERPTVVLAVNSENGADDTHAFWKYETVRQMEDILGINLELRSQTTDQELLMIAAGEIPDIFQARNEFMPQLILGNHIVAMDDLVANYAPNLAADSLRLDFLRRFQSEGTGRLYGISNYTGIDGHMHTPISGHFVRWDLYSELGYPAISTPYDMVDVLAAMVELQPENEHGAPTFALGAFIDWGMWAFTVIAYPGLSGHEVGPLLHVLEDGTHMHRMTDINSNIWGNLRVFNYADRLGVFDRESLVQGYDEYFTKASQGQYMSIMANWIYGGFNLHMRETHGEDTLIGHHFMPYDGFWDFSNNYAPFGNTDFLWVIGANSNVQSDAMRLIDYLNSYDGVRQLMSGTLENTLEMVNGRPEIRSYLLDDNPDFEGVLWSNANMMGLAGPTLHPVDGQPLNLMLTPRAFSLQNTHLHTVASAHFGAEFPYGIVQNWIAEGRGRDQITWNHTITSAVPVPPMNIQRIDDLLNEIIWRAVPEAILAPTDEAFQEIFANTVAELEAAGHAQSLQWWTEAYYEALEAVAEFVR